MKKKRKQEPRGVINRYIAAVEAGEEPDPPVFFRPGDDESIDAFVDRVWEATRHWAVSDSGSGEVHSRDVPKRRKRS